MITVRPSLIPASDEHFAWMLGELPSCDDLSLPPGGVDQPDVIGMLRKVAAGLRPVCPEASWIVVDHKEVVGLCSIKGPPKDGIVEIGFGIAVCRRNQGYATEAVRAMVAQLGARCTISMVVAMTAVDNIASQTVLRRNGFANVDRTQDPDEGELILWQFPMRQNSK